MLLYLAQCNFPRMETLQSQCVLWYGNVTSERSINRTTMTGTALDRAWKLWLRLLITIIFIIHQRERKRCCCYWSIIKRKISTERIRVWLCYLHSALLLCMRAEFQRDTSPDMMSRCSYNNFEVYGLRALIEIPVWK